MSRSRPAKAEVEKEVSEEESISSHPETLGVEVIHVDADEYLRLGGLTNASLQLYSLTFQSASACEWNKNDDDDSAHTCSASDIEATLGQVYDRPIKITCQIITKVVMGCERNVMEAIQNDEVRFKSVGEKWQAVVLTEGLLSTSQVPARSAPRPPSAASETPAAAAADHEKVRIRDLAHMLELYHSYQAADSVYGSTRSVEFRASKAGFGSKTQYTNVSATILPGLKALDLLKEVDLEVEFEGEMYTIKGFELNIDDSEVTDDLVKLIKGIKAIQSFHNFTKKWQESKNSKKRGSGSVATEVTTDPEPPVHASKKAKKDSKAESAAEQGSGDGTQTQDTRKKQKQPSKKKESESKKDSESESKKDSKSESKKDSESESKKDSKSESKKDSKSESKKGNN